MNLVEDLIDLIDLIEIKLSKNIDYTKFIQYNVREVLEEIQKLLKENR